ncbi:MAG: TIGR04282 family arsenosugar biosynthesis glycosyltransferase [Burkholderiales bacterium]|jgi:rSAM/selenodomain-associated transferase 1|nr:TIGR04282 family arsenosugar biosynthesis glycosyltransferase [Burkholderiales bacterium]
MRAEPPVDIAVFARAPVAGQVKTRLIPLLGADGAAALQRRLIERTLATARAVDGARVTLWVAGEPAHPFVEQMAARFGVALAEQHGADLGERMHRAFETTAAPLVLIGTDCPRLSPQDLAEASAALAAHDVVLQPATDGGYVLIGLVRPQPPLFESIDWGGPQVLQQTQARIGALGLHCALRPPLDDLDTPADLQRALAAGWLPVA